jgi:hypothetical protein
LSKRKFDQYVIGKNLENWGNSYTTQQLFLRIKPGFNVSYFCRTIFPTNAGRMSDFTENLDFGIWDKYTVIEMHLTEITDEINWRWSSKLDAFTTKDIDRSHIYGDLHYKANPSESDWISADDWFLQQQQQQQQQHQKTAKSIKFHAKRQPYVNGIGYHAFNLNIEIKQSDGKWLPITIDPDVRNPPTRPGRELDDYINDKINEEKDKSLEEKIFLFDSSIET